MYDENSNIDLFNSDMLLDISSHSSDKKYIKRVSFAFAASMFDYLKENPNISFDELKNKIVEHYGVDNAKYLFNLVNNAVSIVMDEMDNLDFSNSKNR